MLAPAPAPGCGPLCPLVCRLEGATPSEGATGGGPSLLLSASASTELGAAPPEPPSQSGWKGSLVPSPEPHPSWRLGMSDHGRDSRGPASWPPPGLARPLPSLPCVSKLPTPLSLLLRPIPRPLARLLRCVRQLLAQHSQARVQ